MNAFDTTIMTNIVFNEVQKSKEFLDNVIRSRMIQNTMQFQTNEKEIDALNDIVKDTGCSIFVDGSSISLELRFDKKDNWYNIILHGMKAPLTGGNGGIAHNPDGSTYESQVPPQLQRRPIEEFAKEGIPLEQEILTIVETLYDGIVKEAAHACSDEIAEAYKPYIIEQINKVLGGRKHARN